MLRVVEGLDATTKRSNHSGAELRDRVRAQARLAREFGQGGLRFTDKVRLAYWNAFQHDCLNNAKAAAYSAIFAIFPAVGVLAAVMTLLPDAAPLRTQWVAVLNRALPASVASMFETYFTSSPGARQSAGVLLGAAATSIYGAAGVLATMMEGFRRAHDLPVPATKLSGHGDVRGVLRKLVQLFLLVPMAMASALVVFGHFCRRGLHLRCHRRCIGRRSCAGICGALDGGACGQHSVSSRTVYHGGHRPEPSNVRQHA